MQFEAEASLRIGSPILNLTRSAKRLTLVLTLRCESGFQEFVEVRREACAAKDALTHQDCSAMVCKRWSHSGLFAKKVDSVCRICEVRANTLCISIFGVVPG